MTDSILTSYQRYPQSTLIPSPIVEVPLLLDAYPGAAMAYSMRKLSSTATYAIDLFVTGPNITTPVGWDANGDFDVATAATLIGANTGYVSGWYDQSGNGHKLGDLFQSNRYDAVGIGGKASVGFQTGGTFPKISAAFDLSTSVSTQCTLFAVMNQDGTRAQNCLCAWGSGTNEFNVYATYNDDLYFTIGDYTGSSQVIVAQPSGWDDTDHILECYRDSSDNQAIVVDGSSLVSATRTDDLDTGSSVFSVGALATGPGATAMLGQVAEFIIWGTDLGSTDRAAVRANMSSYYSI